MTTESPTQSAPRAPRIIARVTNATTGRTFNVVLVRPGDCYGLDDRLIHDGPDPLIEFWDATYEHDIRFTLGRGQFVTRYYLNTLIHDEGVLQAGLNLCPGVHDWRLTYENVTTVLAAAATALQDEDPTREAREDRERLMFGCTASQLDMALTGKDPRDIAMYAMGTLSNAQELIQRDARANSWFVSDHHANTLRQLINIAKYAIDKAAPR